MSEDIITLRTARHDALARYDASEQADRDNPYHDGRRSSRACETAYNDAIQAISAYRQARLELQAWHMTIQVVCALWQERERAA